MTDDHHNNCDDKPTGLRSSSEGAMVVAQALKTTVPAKVTNMLISMTITKLIISLL